LSCHVRREVKSLLGWSRNNSSNRRLLLLGVRNSRALPLVVSHLVAGGARPLRAGLVVVLLTVAKLTVDVLRLFRWASSRCVGYIRAYILILSGALTKNRGRATGRANSADGASRGGHVVVGLHGWFCCDHPQDLLDLHSAQVEISSHEWRSWEGGKKNTYFFSLKNKLL